MYLPLCGPKAKILSVFPGRTGELFLPKRNMKIIIFNYSLNGVLFPGVRKRIKRRTADCYIIRLVNMAQTMVPGCVRRNFRSKKAIAAITGVLPGEWLTCLLIKNQNSNLVKIRKGEFIRLCKEGRQAGVA